jgi:protein KRI1
VEEKLGKTSAFGKNSRSDRANDGNEQDDESESDSEDEDDEGILATGALDSAIHETLQAIRSKDPRVYDGKTTFYAGVDDTEMPEKTSEPKPMFLRDYHRENILKATNGEVEDEAVAPKTYAQEQEHLKHAIVKEMHAAADDDEDENEDDDEEEDGFLVRKEKKADTSSEPPVKITEEDVVEADKDPEKFLSNFLAARAWVPTDRANFQPFESDDEQEDQRAEAFEEAYNLRFEDPTKLNEHLVTHARDTAAKFSVRREEPSARKRKRDAEMAKKDEEKKQRETERARLRKLKIEQLQEQVEKIRNAAGIKASEISDEDWARFLDEGWDDKQWEEEMKKRFGDDYYAAGEAADDEEEDEAEKSKKKRLKKPTWDDDIDIKDLVPDFDDEGEAASDESDADEEMAEGDEDGDGEAAPRKKKDRIREKKDKQKEARKERQRIEKIVDKSLQLEPSLLPGSSKKYSATFRYRESSPVSFGLTARDILMAEDRHLNQYAGLKKLASFRDPEKKKRDRKRLGKKARLREWRKETFGNEDGPPMEFSESAFNRPAEANKAAPVSDGRMDVDIREGAKKKRKRSKKQRAEE